MSDRSGTAPAPPVRPAAPLHVVISRWGSPGDVLPYIAVGWALAGRGHDVTFVGSPHYEARAREAGLAFEAVGTLQDHERLMADADVWERSRKSPEQVFRDHYYPHLPQYFDAVMRLASRPRAVVVSGEAGGISAAERSGAPFVSIAVSPATSRFVGSRHDPPHPERVLPPWAAWVARSGAGLRLLYTLNHVRHRRGARSEEPARLPADHPLGRLRAAHDLPPTLSLAPRLALCLWPEWFAPPQRDWPTTARAIGFPFYPPPVRAGSGGPPADESAPIVVTTGSVAGSQFRFYATAVEACRMLQRPAVLVSPHREHIPEALPPNITYLAFAPFNDLMGRASLVIHHGGIGTASYALAAGVPQVALPMRGDQFDNGNRLQRLGVATMLAAARTGPADLARAIAGLTSSPRTAARCRHWQALTDTTGCLPRAAEAIEALA